MEEMYKIGEKVRALRYICKLGGIIIAVAILGVMALTLVCMIPVDGAMKDHAGQALEVFEREGAFPKLWGEKIGSSLDNFTDALMVQTAVFDGSGTPFEKAVKAERIQKDLYTADPIADLKCQLEGNGHVLEYARYWHGYLIFLKPLLFFFSYYQIRLINGCIQIVLLIALIWIMYKRNLKKYILPFIVALLSIAPWILPFSLQNSTMFYIVIISLIFLIKEYEFINKYKNFYFLLLGISTSFFDLLTYPIVSIGMPLVFYWLISINEKKTLTFKCVLIETFVAGLHWSIGYVGVWAVKWFLGGMVLGSEMLRNTLASLEVRSLGETGQVMNSYIMVCLRNSRRLFNFAFCFALFTYIVFCVLYYSGKFYVRIKDNYIFVLLALIPFAWYLVTKNHADIHIHFTYRNLWISVFAILCMFRNFMPTLDKNKVRD